MFAVILRSLGPMLSIPVDLLTLDKIFLTKPVLVSGILNSIPLFFLIAQNYLDVRVYDWLF